MFTEVEPRADSEKGKNKKSIHKEPRVCISLFHETRTIPMPARIHNK